MARGRAMAIGPLLWPCADVRCADVADVLVVAAQVSCRREDACFVAFLKNRDVSCGMGGAEQLPLLRPGLQNSAVLLYRC